MTLQGLEAKGKNHVLRINDEENTDPNLISNEFKDFFSSVASSLASTIPPVDFDPLTIYGPNSVFRRFSEHDLR